MDLTPDEQPDGNSNPSHQSDKSSNRSRVRWFGIPYPLSRTVNPMSPHRATLKYRDFD